MQHSRFLPAPFPVRHNSVLAAAHGQGAGLYVLAYRGAGGDGGAGVDGEGGDEFGVGADEYVITDDGFVLLNAVVVTGNGAGADVDPCSDLAVADVAEMVGLGALAQGRLFYFDKITDMHILIEAGTGADAGERADPVSGADLGVVDDTVG